MHVQVVVLLIKPIDFLDVLVAVASLNLYVPKNQSIRERCWLMQRSQLFPTQTLAKVDSAGRGRGVTFILWTGFLHITGH